MKQAELAPVNDHALATVEPRPSINVAQMFEAIAANPNVDVVKLEKLIELQERLIQQDAKAAFDAAFSAMQGDIPAIVERAKTNNGRYAPLEDIIEVVRPILRRHGFSLSHKTEWPDKTTVKIIGILAHRQGYQRESEFLSAADASGNKNAIQGLGSAMSYGRRYTTKDLLGIVTREEDDDGRASGRPTPPPEPAGYEDWLTDMGAVVSDGLKALQDAWNASKKEYRDYLTSTNLPKWNEMKTRAAKLRPIR